MRLVVVGADGRMGRMLVRAVAQAEGCTLSAAIERAGGTPSEAFAPVLRNAVTTEFHHVEALKAADKALRAAALAIPFPNDAPTRLLRRGVVSCSSMSGCSLVLYPVSSVRSLE